jgi:hypothetical protein
VKVFGAEGTLVGVLAEPEGAEAFPGAPAVLLGNVGIHHRVGPGRVWVDLSRRLAALGYPTLRFDQSGLGDSAPGSDTRDELARGVADLRAAMDMLEKKHGVRRFVLVGFCSGVDTVHRAAVEDARVADVAWVEGYCYPTPRFRLRHALRYADPQRWRRAAHRLGRRLRGEPLPGEPTEEGGAVMFARQQPEVGALGRELDGLLGRGARMLAVYSAGFSAWYNYEGQFFDMFPGRDFRGRVEVSLYAQADHLFGSLPERERLLGHLTRWVRAGHPRPASGAADAGGPPPARPAPPAGRTGT